MICLEVSLNGNVLCTSGNERGAVDVHLWSHSLLPEAWDAELNLREMVFRPPSTGEDLAPKLSAALQHPERPASTHSVYWIDRKKLKAGDEIRIKLVDVAVDHLAPIPDARAGSN